MIFRSSQQTPLTETPSSLKFTLYIKKKEIHAMTSVLEKALSLPLNQRQVWTEEHGEFIQSALDAFVDESTAIFDTVVLDEETLGLSENIIVLLREALRKADAVFAEYEQLNS